MLDADVLLYYVPADDPDNKKPAKPVKMSPVRVKANDYNGLAVEALKKISEDAWWKENLPDGASVTVKRIDILPESL